MAFKFFRIRTAKTDTYLRVADSSLITEDNLQQIDKYDLKFISRLPGNFALEKELKDGKGRLSSPGMFLREKGCSLLPGPGIYRGTVWKVLSLFGRALFQARRPEGEVPGKRDSQPRKSLRKSVRPRRKASPVRPMP